MGSNLERIYEIIDQKYVYDSLEPIKHSTEEIDEIQSLLLDEVRANMAMDGFMTLDQIKANARRFVADSFLNPANLIGTQSDPGYWNQSMTPVSLSPNDATAFYSSGGLAARIINKKVEGILLNGYHFESNLWTPEDLERLYEYAESVELTKHLMAAERDGLIYGGSIIVPAFKNDNPQTYRHPVRAMHVEKDSLSYFWTADRWNAVLIPDYNISAADYLTPKQFYVPIAGLTISTKRLGVIRPKMLPYWGTIRQIGWGVSDYEGPIKSILAYQVAMASIPIMAQQMSLLYRHVPLDGMLAENGPAALKAFTSQDEAAMAGWSQINPKTFNSFGEFKTIDRTYTGFPELIQLLRQDIGAQSELGESVLFDTPTPGMADNTHSTELGQGEVIRRLGNTLATQLPEIVRILVSSCFGPDSEQARTASKVRISFESPTIITPEQRQAQGVAFFQMLSSGAQAGLAIPEAAQLAIQFVDDVTLPDELGQSSMAGEPDDGWMQKVLGQK